ncbi:hypothetical protein RRF57_002580 [Xylaria bambusicola]|uniref:Hydrophobin n=1 Tax=Xylaria bambusicola TaxID=326684 RepID=A0AAN7U6J0_9PEZI
MQYSLIAILGFAAAAFATPTNNPPEVLCPSGLYSTPQCCAPMSSALLTWTATLVSSPYPLVLRSPWRVI